MHPSCGESSDTVVFVRILGTLDEDVPPFQSKRDHPLSRHPVQAHESYAEDSTPYPPPILAQQAWPS